MKRRGLRDIGDECGDQIFVLMDLTDETDSDTDKVGNGNNDAMFVYYYESNTPSMAQPYISAISLRSSFVVTQNAIHVKPLSPAKTNYDPSNEGSSDCPIHPLLSCLLFFSP